MATVPLRLIPTVNVEPTETLNEAGISSCNLIRIKAKLPQKLGGWEKFYPLSVLGTPRDLHAWQDLNSIDHLALGTTQQFAIITSGTLSDITPQTLLSDFAPDFTTTISTTTVKIDDPNIANVTAYDSVFFNTPISVGGIILSGLYPIATITGATTYTIVAADAATASVANGGSVPSFHFHSGSSEVHVLLNDHGMVVDNETVFPISTSGSGVTILGTYDVVQVSGANEFSITGDAEASSTSTVAMNGGEAQILYYINLGPAATGAGFGLGGYGLGAYGTGIVPTAQTGLPITATNWTSDNWGEIILGCPEGGGIYYWSPTGGFENASLVSGAPIFNGGIFVAMPQQMVIAWGSTSVKDIGVQQDPLLVRWSDSENFFEWMATSSTQAGSFRIPTGSKIIGGLQGPQQALIWTDLDIYAMKYLRPPLVWGFTQLSSGCGLIGPHAADVLRGNVYWMSSGNFFVLSGQGVRPIPCSVWDVVFQNLDTANQHKCVAAPNSAFDEIWFFYPSAGGTGENDSYVKFNIEENSWDYGPIPRSAWIDQSILGEPIGASPSGIIYQHETSPDADGQPLNSWFETGYFVLSEGHDLAFVDWFFPDMKWGNFGGAQTATVSVTITAVDYPNGTERVYGPFSMTSAKNFVNTRLRGRQIKFKFESNDIGSFWRLGLLRIRANKDGSR